MKRRFLPTVLLLFVCVTMNSGGNRTDVPAASADSPDVSNWSLRIEATATGVRDSLALMGVRPDATPDYDPQYEVPRPPPPPGGYVMVYFPHDSGNWPTLLGPKYAVDFTTPGKPSWRLTVETNVGPCPVTLSWDSSVIANFPQSYSIVLTDDAADSVVLMRDLGSYTFSYTTPRTFHVTVELASTFITVTPGWNIVSVPRITDDVTAAGLFPGKVSAAYAYDDAYTARDTLSPGRGYWVKYPSAAYPVMSGLSIDSMDIPLRAGWNLIGSISRTIPAPVSANLATPIYEYSGGYHRADSMIPGRGYWIKAFTDGILTLGATSESATGAGQTPGAVRSADPQGESPDGTPRGTGTLEISDGAGGSTLLHLLPPSVADDRGMYALPPVPPSGGFDARFSHGGAAAIPGAGPGTSVAIVVQSASGILRFHGIPDDPSEEYLLETGPDEWKAISGTAEPVAITCSPGRKFFHLRLSHVEAAPRAFILEQNYPNPFNPSTAIRYRLEADSRIWFSVCDLNGRLIFRTEDYPGSAGDHVILFDAAQFRLAGGIYVYSISVRPLSGARTSVGSGKMMYLK